MPSSRYMMRPVHFCVDKSGISYELHLIDMNDYAPSGSSGARTLRPQLEEDHPGGSREDTYTLSTGCGGGWYYSVTDITHL